MNAIPESKKNHLWRKTVWHTDPEEFPLGPHHAIEIYCCEEANGYAIWYVRRLGKDDTRGLRDIENGDYLIEYLAKTRRDDAIEHAVLLAHGAEVGDRSIDALIAALDQKAAQTQKV